MPVPRAVAGQALRLPWRECSSPSRQTAQSAQRGPINPPTTRHTQPQSPAEVRSALPPPPQVPSPRQSPPRNNTLTSDWVQVPNSGTVRAATCFPKAKTSFLTTWQSLSAGDYLPSDNGLFFAQLTTEGNLCVYRGSNPVNKRELCWQSGTSSGSGPYYLVTQSDGNLCIYRGKPSNMVGFVWDSSSVDASGGDFHLSMQADGNLCIFRGKSPSDQRALFWSTGAPATPPDFNTVRVTANGAAFACDFSIQWNGGESDRSNRLLAGMTNTLDIPPAAIAAGASCWLRAYVVGGGTHDSGDNFVAGTNHFVQYEIKGTTGTPSWNRTA